MVQGVFLELGSCFLAKMACISPTKSRVKHRTLKKNLTFFSALSTRPTIGHLLSIDIPHLHNQHLPQNKPTRTNMQENPIAQASNQAGQKVSKVNTKDGNK